MVRRAEHPSLLDFVDGVPYLVVTSNLIYRYGSLYAQTCKALLGPADKSNPRLDTYQAFIKNPARVTHNIRPRICNVDALWVIDYVAERGRAVLIKANAAGEVLYRISFEKPPGADAYSGGIAQSTFRAEGGYVYFDWWDTGQSGNNRHVHSNLKVRIREPVQHALRP
ncbi:MAG: hypothetical protein HYY78_04035 [Betaproteobacteria bacterium]|nr:hypothetical protein [Betaproteobacteria bacterium]